MALPVGLHHASFTVSDLPRSVEFYQRLGFQVERTNTVEEAAYVGGRLDMVFLTGAGIRLELLAYEAAGEGAPPREAEIGSSHIALQVDDIQAWHRELSGDGVRFLSEPIWHEHARAKWVFMLDPDGLRIELVELDTDANLTTTTEA